MDIEESTFSPKLLEQEADQEVKDLLAITYTIRQSASEDPDIDYSFTLVFMSFLAASDSISRWFQDYTEQAQIEVDGIYKTKLVDRFVVQKAYPTSVPFSSRTRFTQSTTRIFEKASKFVARTNFANQSIQQSSVGPQTAALGTRHIMAAYIYNPGEAHEKQLKSYGFSHRHWSNSFIEFVRSNYSDDNISEWENIHEQYTGQRPSEKRIRALKKTRARQSPNLRGKALGSINPGDTYTVLSETADWYEIDYSGQSGFVQAADITVVIDTPRLRDWLPGFDSDARASHDLLGIDDDVRPLAMLIAARDTVPPLSIGIFGNWGSGKSFFMEQMRQQIAKYAARAQTEASLNKIFFPYIVQVEFNAWHYIEGNLWASLVEHILTSLRSSHAPTAKDIEAGLLKKLQFVDQQVKQAQIHKENIEEVLREAEAEVKRIKDEHDEASRTLKDISAWDVLQKVELPDALKNKITTLLDQLNISSALQSAADFQSALAGARALLTRGNALLTTLQSDKDQPWFRPRGFYLVLLVLFVPTVGLVVGLVASTLGDEGIAQISAFLGGVTAAIASGIGWFTKQSERVSKLLSEVEAANQQIDQAAEKKRAEKMGELTAAEQRLAQLNMELAAAAGA